MSDRSASNLIACLTAAMVIACCRSTLKAETPLPASTQSLIDQARDHWSFQRVVDHAPPSVRGTVWVQSPIDHFILARLETAGMTPNAPADKRTLLRRATFDLTGLPPTPGETAEFLADDSPQAFEKIIDRLLASHHYGERWGRHWLDVVRYADTSGCNADVPIPDAYRYRNYVIDAFNADKPFDRFVREQIAGDLLPADRLDQRNEQVIATGYLAISRRFSSLAEEFHLTLEDTIDNLGKSILGLSLGCARCHDHKYDPVPTQDYYALYGIFSSSRFAFPGTEIPRHSNNMMALVPTDLYEKTVRPYEQQLAQIDAKITATYAMKAASDTGPEKNKHDKLWKELVAQRDEMIKRGPRYEKAFAVSEGRAADARVQIKGDPTKLGEPVRRRFLLILGGHAMPDDDHGSGRLQLADWLTDPANPLTARVMVNRIWQHHFGRGIVRTPNDFGVRGSPPTHPELLDWLTCRFIDSGWSVKKMHKLLTLSAAYQMSSDDRVDDLTADPENKLLWKFSRRRLEAEELRDAMLAVSGALDRSRGGEHPFQPEWEWRYTQHRPFIADFQTDQRSIYLPQQRIRKQPFLEVFDGADTNASTGQRNVSTTALQALFLINSEFVHEQARLLAGRLAQEADSSADRIALAYELAFSRPATAEETAVGRQFLQEISAKLPQVDGPADSRDREAWASYLRVLLASNEFAFVD